MQVTVDHWFVSYASKLISFAQTAEQYQHNNICSLFKDEWRNSLGVLHLEIWQRHQQCLKGGQLQYESSVL